MTRIRFLSADGTRELLVIAAPGDRLLDLAQAHCPAGLRLTRFEYRALSPTFGGLPLAVNGQPTDDGRSAQVWAAGPSGGQTMAGTVNYG